MRERLAALAEYFSLRRVFDFNGFLDPVDRPVSAPAPVAPSPTAGPCPRLPEQDFYDDKSRLEALVTPQISSSEAIAPDDFAQIADLTCKVAGYFPHPIAALTIAYGVQSQIQQKSPAQGLELAMQLFGSLRAKAADHIAVRVPLLEAIHKLTSSGDAEVAARAQNFIALHERDVILANMGGAGICIGRAPA